MVQTSRSPVEPPVRDSRGHLVRWLHNRWALHVEAPIFRNLWRRSTMQNIRVRLTNLLSGRDRLKFVLFRVLGKPPRSEWPEDSVPIKYNSFDIKNKVDIRRLIPQLCDNGHDLIMVSSFGRYVDIWLFAPPLFQPIFCRLWTLEMRSLKKKLVWHYTIPYPMW